jgi:tRNA (guanine-N7-)-methyltransferase
MRIRKKAWGPAELAACPYYVADPIQMAGRWREAFPQDGPLHLELGCGKCVSTSQMALANPGVNYLAVDEISDMLARAHRVIDEAYSGAPVENLRITPFDCMYISQYILPEDRVERIYINFCNPWTQKTRHEKRRLTHPRQLEQYRGFLAPGGQIYFKTDDDALFDASLEYFRICGFMLDYCTRDLHASGFLPNYMSEHEIMFTRQGIPTKFLIARI